MPPLHRGHRLGRYLVLDCLGYRVDEKRQHRLEDGLEVVDVALKKADRDAQAVRHRLERLGANLHHVKRGLAAGVVSLGALERHALVKGNRRVVSAHERTNRVL